jgi:endoglucanase
MKNKKTNAWSFALAKLQVIIAIAMITVIGFAFITCDDGNNNNNNNNENNGGDDPGGQTPGGQTPGGQTPGGQTPNGDPRPTAPEAMSTKTALQYFTDNNIRVGWNLGNTLDAVNVPSAAAETAWGNPAATQALFNGIKQSGFDIVRIPSTWIGHIGSAPNYTVSEARLKRVAEVVGYAKTAGFKAVIINIHHDGNFTNGTSTWGFVDMKTASTNTTKKNEVQNQITKVWTQIAEYFKNYGDYLIFETLNEVHSGNWGFGASTTEQDILFDWNQAALSAIRATGGNNATRYVAVPGLGSTEPDIVVAANNRNKLLPNDGSNGTNKLIVSVHYYAPTQYTVAGVTDPQPLVHTWGNSSEINSLNHEMELLKTNFIDKGIAVYAGEWGAPTDVRSSMNQTIKDTHLNYIRSVATAARANGVIPIYWDDGGNFKVLERSNGRPKTGLWADVLSTMMTAINNTTPTPPTPPGGKTITLNPNVYDAGDGQGSVAHGYQAKVSISELTGGSIQVANGNTFNLTYTFTSNVAIGNLQVVLVDTRPPSYYTELSGYVDIGAVTVGTPVNGNKTITATATAGDSSNDANQFVFSIGETSGAASAPTLTFTAFTLVKN